MAQDIASKSFWDKFPALKPFALLARWDRPIGIWLLYWPAIWGLTLAPSFQNLTELQQLSFLFLFFIGAIAMRGAGCTVNDITDRNLDTLVERTKHRPLAAKTLTVKQAVVFLMLQCLIGAAVLFQLSPTAIVLGLCTLPLIVTYPFMKRLTWWPQIFLGIVFNGGALIGWAAIENSLSLAPILLYLSGIFWTVAYDTVYAHIDADDDVFAGIKSTALRWGPDSKKYVGACFAVCIVLFAAALSSANARPLSYLMLTVAATIMIVGYTFWNPDNKQYSLGYFRLQARIGFLLALGTLASVIF